jgi:hypothetical protein
MMSVDGQWVTDRDLAARLGVSVEAARRQAPRGEMGAHVRERRHDARQTAVALMSALTPSVRCTRSSPKSRGSKASLTGKAQARADAADAQSISLSADLAAERAKASEASSVPADRLRQQFLKRLKQRLVG